MATAKILGGGVMPLGAYTATDAGSRARSRVSAARCSRGNARMRPRGARCYVPVPQRLRAMAVRCAPCSEYAATTAAVEARSHPPGALSYRRRMTAGRHPAAQPGREGC
ncbi:hypothetical protein [Parvivirga hydrogeniphila]|uniref:hypothetical protein n=1 Tax=Parvivirga hydrogeniphila TaxID=2939460 RepID=UPI003899931B